jgi:hypothetical protein
MKVTLFQKMIVIVPEREAQRRQTMADLDGRLRLRGGQGRRQTCRRDAPAPHAP